jgi:hypothetical protein
VDSAAAGRVKGALQAAATRLQQRWSGAHATLGVSSPLAMRAGAERMAV